MPKAQAQEEEGFEGNYAPKEKSFFWSDYVFYF